jgi:hypothetical protein
MIRAVALKGAGYWQLILVRYASRRVRRLLFETYLNPFQVMSDEPSSLSRDSVDTALETVLGVATVLAPGVRC